MPLSQCNTKIWNYNKEKNLPILRNGISESQYCASDRNRNSDDCEGYGGGSLQIVKQDSVTTKIVGVASFDVECGTELPSIYTRVAYYLKWIEAHVWPNGSLAEPLISVQR